MFKNDKPADDKLRNMPEESKLGNLNFEESQETFPPASSLNNKLRLALRLGTTMILYFTFCQERKSAFSPNVALFHYFIAGNTTHKYI